MHLKLLRGPSNSGALKSMVGAVPTQARCRPCQLTAAVLTGAQRPRVRMICQVANLRLTLTAMPLRFQIRAGCLLEFRAPISYCVLCASPLACVGLVNSRLSFAPGHRRAPKLPFCQLLITCRAVCARFRAVGHCHATALCSIGLLSVARALPAGLQLGFHCHLRRWRVCWTLLMVHRLRRC